MSIKVTFCRRRYKKIRSPQFITKGVAMCNNNFKIWDLKELKQHTNKLNRNIPKVLFETIEWKLFQIRYHADKATEIIKKIFPKNGFEMNDPQLKENWSKATAEFVAFSHAFDTINDILLQVLNHAYLDTPLINPLNAKQLIEEIRSKNSEATVINAAYNFLNDSRVSYIRSFINMEKHQHLVGLNCLFRLVQGEPPKTRFKIKQFNNGKQGFSEKWVDEIINTYPDILIKAMRNVGNSINEDLKNEAMRKI